jgi:hypothetical protein
MYSNKSRVLGYETSAWGKGGGALMTTDKSGIENLVTL